MEGDGGVSNRTWLSKRTCWSNRATGVPSWVRLLNHGSCCDGIRRSNAGGKQANRRPGGLRERQKLRPGKAWKHFSPMGSLLKHLARGSPAREDKKIPPAGPSRKKANLGERKASLPEKKANLGERKASLPGKKAHLVERKASLRGKKANLGERKASLPEKKAHLCERKASLPGKKAHLCGRKASLPEKKAHLCERKASLPEKKANLCGRKGACPKVCVSGIWLCFGLGLFF